MDSRAYMEPARSRLCRPRLSLLCVVFVLALAVACGSVGGGPYEQQGYQACAPIIEALQQYHEATGQYPATLEELIPDYLQQIPSEVNGFPLHYARIGEGQTQTYALAFAFPAGAGATCSYMPEDGWKCHVTQ